MGAPSLQTAPPDIPEKTQLTPESVRLASEPILNVECWILIPSHINWNYRPVVRRVVRWAKNVAQGKDDRRQSGTVSEFVEGGTIGPVPGRPDG